MDALVPQDLFGGGFSFLDEFGAIHPWMKVGIRIPGSNQLVQ
jgi:hypothetical protein